MSSGAFALSRYKSNAGVFYTIKVQPETLNLTIGTIANAPATEATTDPKAEVSAIASGGKRLIGMHARRVSFRFTGTPPTGYLANSLLRVPILNAAVWNPIVRSNTGTYLGGTISVVGKTPEYVV